MEQHIMDRFESLAFAGLSSDRYNILWVRHSHAGHHELHFVTPRVELETGKSFNIKPPGERTQQQFDDLRSEINARFGLADPTDPDRARGIAIPDHILKIDKNALRSNEKAIKDVRGTVDSILTQRASVGLIKGRDDVISDLKELGFEIARAGKDYITALDPETQNRFRLKGPLYARDFEPSEAIRRTLSSRTRDYTQPCRETAEHFEKRVRSHITARAHYNRERYPASLDEIKLEGVPPSYILANSRGSRPMSGFVDWLQHGRELLHESDRGSTQRNNDPSRDTPTRDAQTLGQSTRLQWAGLRSSRPISDVQESPRSNLGSDSEIKHDDRTRDPLIDRIKDFGERVQHKARSLRRSTSHFKDMVLSYLSRKRGIETPSDTLERANRDIEQSIEQVRTLVQNEKVIERQIRFKGLEL
jgi:hypothetical protein